MLQRSSVYVLLAVVAASICLMGESADGQVMVTDDQSDLDNFADWRDARDLRSLRDIQASSEAFYPKRAFHAMRGKKAAPFHAMRGKKLKGHSGDFNTIIAELRRQIMAGKRGESIEAAPSAFPRRAVDDGHHQFSRLDAFVP